MRKSQSIRGSRTGAILAMATGSLLSFGLRAEGGTSYSYVGSTGGSWSNTANWSPSSSYPQTGDTGNLGDATANRVVIYDTGATAALGTLTFAQTDPFENQLDVQKALTITSPVTLGSAGGGTADFLEDAALGTNVTTTFSGGLTINSGGVLEIQTGANSASSQLSNIAGSTTVNGGVFSIDQAVATSAGGSAVETSGTLTVNSGSSVEFGVIGPAGLSASLLGVNSGTYAVNKYVALGNLSIAANSSVLLGTKTTASTSDLWSSANISIGTLASGSVVPTVGLVGGGTNTLTSDAPIAGGLYLRPLYDTDAGSYYSLINDTIGSLTGTTLTLGSSGTGSPGAAIQFIGGFTNGTISLALSSNVTTSNLPISGSLSGATTSSFVIDTKGKTLNLGTAAETLANVNTQWTLTSSAPGGQIDAATFNLSQGGAGGGGSQVGPNLNLQATGGNSSANVLSDTNNLIFGTAAPGTIAPTSTFTYAGTAVVATPATLASSRTIGNLAVTSGALQLASSITTGSGSSTTVALNATLDTGNYTLTTTNLTVNGTLSGTAANSSVSLSGVLAGTGTVGATNGISITSSGGLSPAGAGTVGTLTIASGTSALTLSTSGTSTFDLASDSSFDTLKLNNVSITYAGTLNANFSYAPNVGTTNYAIFSGMGAESGNFTTVTTNLPSATDTVTFDPNSGVLTVVATPEPASAMTLGVFSLGLLARRRRRRA